MTKILHACNEDLLVFLQEFDALPQPMMDTQIMARFLGFANSAGLAKLVLHYLGVEMDKGATRTNWLKRPLSPAQLQLSLIHIFDGVIEREAPDRSPSKRRP